MIALLQAIAERLIPGIPSTLRVTLVTQILKEDATTAVLGASTVLEHVIGGHVQLSQAKWEYDRMSDPASCIS